MVSRAGDAIVDAKRLAALLGLSVQDVHQENVFIKVSGSAGQFLFDTSVRNYVRHLREVAAGRQGSELNAIDENARLKIAQRKNYELKNAALEGELISMDDLKEAWGVIVGTLKAMVLSIPSRCQEKLPHLPLADIEAIRKVARKVLVETSGMLPDQPAMPQIGNGLSHDSEGG